MKKLSFLIVTFLFCNFIFSQTTKDHFIIGMSTTLSSIGTGPELFGIGYSSNRIKVGDYKGEPTKTFGVNIIPKVGYFIKDNISLGLDANLSYGSMKIESLGESQTSFFGGLGLFGRYYFTLPRAYPFVEIDAGLGIASIKSDLTDSYGSSSKSKSFFLNMGTGIGLAIPLGDLATFDLFTGYDFINEFPLETYYGQEIKSITHSFGFELGFIIIIDENSLKTKN